jgi:phosphatidylglycerol:prolipoprotein diacylglycerol transferase
MFGIPYTTFPHIQIGPIRLQVFGLCVLAGVFVGTLVAGWYGRPRGLPRDDVLRLAPWLVLAGIVGARLTYVITNFNELGSFWDVFAVWKGGLQFTGGAILATLVALPLLRRLEPVHRWHFADAAALGLTIGQAIGRIGCVAVGEHFGGRTSPPFGLTWRGGPTVEEMGHPVGTVIHQTAAYETLHLLVLFVALLVVLRRRSLAPGVLIGVFSVWYGVLRFLTDFLRVNDRELFGLTGAQYGCLLLVGVGVWILATTRARVERLGAGAAPAGGTTADPAPATAE